MSPQAPARPIFVNAADVPTEQVRTNPALTKLSLLSNFAGGYLVGVSVAFHPAGEGCDLHNHRGAVEVFVVVDGEGVIEVDGVKQEVAPYDTVLVPVGAMHKLTGTSVDAPFTVMCGFVVAPGHENDTQPWRPTE
ncbi:MAG TPA: cupin domain-containing protein [Candidatus Saccharimonadales bacterium]|nr:cupin domain-containing protein [Candidatus Saccharimonadales bacterium]